MSERPADCTMRLRAEGKAAPKSGCLVAYCRNGDMMGCPHDKIGHGGYPVPRRSGSFPLMNLAADYGVAYSDVLLMSDVERRRHTNDVFNDALCEVALSAFYRAADRISDAGRLRSFHNALIAHTDARWGRP